MSPKSGFKTLVVHPNDPTTTFLSKVYRRASNTELITGPTTKEDLREKLSRPDQRIVLLGHGLPHGLLNIRGFLTNETSGIAIGDQYAAQLKNQQNHILIFCYAHTFASRLGISGFRCDMFISETREALYCGLGKISEEEINFSNILFAKLIGEVFHEDTREIFRYVKSNYGKFSKTSPIINYNHQRLFHYP